MSQRLGSAEPAESSDAALVQRARRGDDAAFKVLFDRHSARLWHYACMLCGGDFDEAEDLVQETLVRAWRCLDELQAGAALHAWLRTLMYRKALDASAGQKRRAKLLDLNLVEPEGGATPEQRLLRRETGAAIRAAAKRLSVSSRQIFDAFHLEGKSIMEISAATGISVGAVKARLFQGRKKMRKELQAMAPEQVLAAQTPQRLDIKIMGECQAADDPLHPIRLTQPLLARRLLYFCRKSPKNSAELAGLVHADRAYIEDMVPDMVAAELLEEVFPGRYQTAFMFAGATEWQAMSPKVEDMRPGVDILRRYIPRLQAALAQTSLCGWQGCTWEGLAWIVLPIWVVDYGLARQLDSLPDWAKHRIMTYPLRPVDFWYVLGVAWGEGEVETEAGERFHGSAMMTEGDGKGMGNVAEARMLVGGDYGRTIDFEDLDRYVGRLSRGPLGEEDLLEGEKSGDALARYADAGYLVRQADDRWRLGMPVLTAEDDATLVPVVDEIAAELARDFLDGALKAFAVKADELEFGHLLAQPHYLGFLALQRIQMQLAYACKLEGLLPPPSNPGKAFGCWSWYGATRIVRSWSKGR
jgi:RNA polymerase sigma-70 factor, ECF subfamily